MKNFAETQTEIVITGSIEKGFASHYHLEIEKDFCGYNFKLPRGISFKVESIYSVMNSITVNKSAILKFGIAQKHYFTGLFKENGNSGIVASSLICNEDQYLEIYSSFFLDFKDINPDTNITISLTGKITRPIQ
jgi:hypothetical protein